MFQPIMDQILSLARDAWAFMAGLLIVVALLGGMYYILQGTAGAAFGGSRMTSMAIIGVVGLVIIVLFAFLFLPQIGELLKNFQPQPPF
ncbi:MAG: hypothetical protein HYZ25_15430 [Chloroflexi bacterium]|nr:hypothetical protein [Chloroflexota bacterium]